MWRRLSSGLGLAVLLVTTLFPSSGWAQLASQTALAWGKPTIPRGQLLRRYRRYRALYGRVELPPALAWARPSVEAMAELMRDLEPR